MPLLEWLDKTVHLCFGYINISISIGLMFGCMLLLRPVLRRILTPQQRVILWGIGWLPVYLVTWYVMLGWLDFLPVNFRSLTSPRMSYGRDIMAVPSYLPYHYRKPGVYNIVLPGGLSSEIEITQNMVRAIVLLWIVGMIVVAVVFTRRSNTVRKIMQNGVPVPEDAQWLSEFPELRANKVQVRICEHIPTSFVYWGRAKKVRGINYTICLQKELSPEQRSLILRHELNHVTLYHCMLKTYSNCALMLHWFNPMLWLGNKYFCQDLELACDRDTVKQLEPAQRKQYAKTLVELAVGQQMWDVPVCFGESDAAIRVREIVAWKEPGTTKERGKALAQMAAFLFLLLFFVGGPSNRVLPQDVMLIWQQQGGTQQSFVQTVEKEVRTQTRMLDGTRIPDTVGAEEIWMRSTTIWDPPDIFGEMLFYVRISDGSWRQIESFFTTGGGQYKLNLGTVFIVEGEPKLTRAARLF